MASKQNTGSDLHFRTGVTGRLARFIVARRAAGDPFDATVVLPCLIFLTVVWLNQLGRVDDLFVVPALVIPALLAGGWIGVCLGDRGFVRAWLRGMLVGAFEGAALTGLIKEAISQPKAISWVAGFMLLNALMFLLGLFLIGPLSDIFITTEEQWQSAAPIRAKIHQIVRLVFEIKDGVTTGTGLLVWGIRRLGPFLLAVWAAWLIGGSVLSVLKSLLHITN